MIGFYQASEKLFNVLNDHAKVNKVTLGDLADVDQQKQNIYPLAHVIPDTARQPGKTMVYGFTVLLMDLVDVNKEEARDQVEQFYGTDNLQDIWHETLNTLVECIEDFRRGDSYDDGYHIEGELQYEPFYDRFENNLAGWAVNINITVGYGQAIC